MYISCTRNAMRETSVHNVSIFIIINDIDSKEHQSPKSTYTYISVLLGPF